MIKRAIAATALAFGLTACGFTPLYSTQDGAGVASAVRDVHVTSVSGPADVSYHLENELSRSLPGTAGQSARYQVGVTLKDQRRGISVTRSAATTRYDYILNGTYTLTDSVTGDTHRQRLQSIVSYGVVESQYSSVVGREDAIRRAAVDLAQKIEFDIALYFKGRAPEDRSITMPDTMGDVLTDGELNNPTDPAAEEQE